MRYLLVATLLLAACDSDMTEGAGGGVSREPDVCGTDEDCRSSEVCFHETAGSYCTDPCTADSDCGPKWDCELQEEDPDGDCKDLGTGPDGGGFCERFDHVGACLDGSGGSAGGP